MNEEMTEEDLLSLLTEHETEEGGFGFGQEDESIYHFYWANEDENLAGMGCPSGANEFKILREDKGISKIISLTVEPLKPEEYGSYYKTTDILHLPIQDFQAPTLEQFYIFVQFLQDNSSEKIAVHCTAGQGRTGTMLVAYQIYTELKRVHDEGGEVGDVSVDECKSAVRSFAKMPIVETTPQEDFLKACLAIFSDAEAFKGLFYGIVAIPTLDPENDQPVDYDVFKLCPSVATILLDLVTKKQTESDEGIWVISILLKILKSTKTCDSLFPAAPKAIRDLISCATGHPEKKDIIEGILEIKPTGARQKLIITLFLLELELDDANFLNDTVILIDSYANSGIYYSGLAKACALDLQFSSNNAYKNAYSTLKTKFTDKDFESDPLFVELPTEKYKDCLTIVLRENKTYIFDEGSSLKKIKYTRKVEKTKIGDSNPTIELEDFYLQDVLTEINTQGLIQELAPQLEQLIMVIVKSDAICMQMIPANMECFNLVSTIATRLMKRRGLLNPEKLDALRGQVSGNRQKMLLSYILISSHYANNDLLDFAVQVALNCIERSYSGAPYFLAAASIVEAIIREIKAKTYSLDNLNTIMKACNAKRNMVYQEAKEFVGKSEEYKLKILAVIDNPELGGGTSGGKGGTKVDTGQGVINIPQGDVEAVSFEVVKDDQKKTISDSAFSQLVNILEKLSNKKPLQIREDQTDYKMYFVDCITKVYILSPLKLKELLKPLQLIWMKLVTDQESVMNLFPAAKEAELKENLAIFTNFAKYLVNDAQTLTANAIFHWYTKTSKTAVKLILAYILAELGKDQAVDKDFLLKISDMEQYKHLREIYKKKVNL